MSNTAPADQSFNLIEIPRRDRPENATPRQCVRRLVVRHFFAGTPGHRLLATGTREACFAASRLMDGPDEEGV